MKKLIQKTTGYMAAAAILVSFNACEQANDVTPDAALSAQNVAEAHQTNSMNLHQTYTVQLMELNGSGVSGMAQIDLMGDMIEVDLEASGLTPEMEHMQHIHGFTDSNKNAVCPPMSADTDGDGLISLVEGIPYYGAVLVPLTPYPMADATGMVDFMNSFSITRAARPMQNNVIVVHGMYVDGVYDPTIPVACGQIKVMNQSGK
ncbi:hypothetical protein [Pontibacter anaerobius]|uniref:CHRD domain-containing protein n=1 Tax=Pontibacter anaerobius TaxID=2993940 RepID=A0ABT3REJ3_9BACT|nr:hypothetical protein [Pontibacter anaerobius]MCX2739828.1 hypothetical protein [Pontibacter anaerobius]